MKWNIFATLFQKSTFVFMKSLLIILVLSLFIMSSFAYNYPPLKGTISGFVTDGATGNPVAGANIFISDTKTGTITDKAGHYSISNIGEGDHLVEISHVGYTTQGVTVTVAGNTTKDFVLSEAIIENNAVVVTGTGQATTIKKSPFQIDVMRKADLLQTTSSNVIDALTKKPGISALSTGPAISKPFIRGLGYNRVLTVNDGVRQEGQQWGDEHGIEIDDNSINKIEVLKGPASLIYGSDAMAGVINIITNVPVPDKTFLANAGAEYQSNSRLRNVFANLAANKNGFNWNIYGSHKAAADYRNAYDGPVYNSNFKENNFGGYAGRNGGWGYSHLIYSNFDLKTGLIEGERDAEGRFLKPITGGAYTYASGADFTTTTPGFPYQHIRHYKIASDNNFKLGNDNLAVNVGYQRNRREEFGDLDNPDTRALYFDLNTITYTAKLNLKNKNGFKPSIGINGMHQENTNRGEEQLIPDYQLNDLGGFVFVQKDWKKLTVSGGARYDNRNVDVASLQDAGAVKGDAFKESFGNFSGSAGLAYQATKNINLKVNAARAFRAPSIPELASNGAHEGTIRYEYGAANLKSEVSNQFDAAIDISHKHFNLNIAGYVNAFQNFIFYKKLATVNGGDSTVLVDGQHLDAFKFDESKATLAGMEATLDIHPHPIDWLHFANTFSYVEGRFKQPIGGSSNLPFIPAPRLITELRADIKTPGAHFANMYAKVELDNTFKQNRAFTAYETETNTPGYSLLNAGLGTDVLNANGKKLFTINIGGLNLTDKTYQNHLSRLKYAAENLATGRVGVFNSGRNFSVKVSVPLSYKI